MLLSGLVALLYIGTTTAYTIVPGLKKQRIKCGGNYKWIDNQQDFFRLHDSATGDTPQGLKKLAMFRKNDMMKLKDRLGGAGQAGLISYGVLNLCYYSFVTLIFWKITAGNFAGEPLLKRLSKVSVMVWLGSQATKPTRMAGAIVMAPIADRYMTKFQEKFNIQSRTKTFWVLFGLILSTMFVFYGALLASTLLFQKLA